MREIKFRAWDTDLNKYVHAFNYNDYEISDDEGDIYITKNMETSGETPLLELEQFTGLFDKNGKEIYEGDILKRESFISWVITFNNSCFCAANITLPYRPFTLFDVDMSQREVIGNVHENKDLLKGGD